MTTEISRRVIESLLESFAYEFLLVGELIPSFTYSYLSRSENETLVLNSARYFVEYQQMEQRLKLDIPTLSDPVIRDLLQESDRFVSSFNGSWGLFSPFDLINIPKLFSELFAHIWVLLALIDGTDHLGALVISLISAIFPLFLRWCGLSEVIAETRACRQQAKVARREDKLRRLANNDFHRPEIILFGLGPWILQSWGKARRTLLDSERSMPLREAGMPQFLSQINISDLLFALQNVGGHLSEFIYVLMHCGRFLWLYSCSRPRRHWDLWLCTGVLSKR